MVSCQPEAPGYFIKSSLMVRVQAGVANLAMWMPLGAGCPPLAERVKIDRPRGQGFGLDRP